MDKEVRKDIRKANRKIERIEKELRVLELQLEIEKLENSLKVLRALA